MKKVQFFRNVAGYRNIGKKYKSLETWQVMETLKILQVSRNVAGFRNI
jgi:hypothetical protein